MCAVPSGTSLQANSAIKCTIESRRKAILTCRKALPGGNRSVLPTPRPTGDCAIAFYCGSKERGAAGAAKVGKGLNSLPTPTHRKCIFSK